MPRFHVIYRDATGRERAEFVEGPSVAWARAHIEGRAGTEVRVTGQDDYPTEGRDLHAEAEVRATPPSVSLEQALSFTYKMTAIAVMICLAVRWWAGSGVLFVITAVIATTLILLQVGAVAPLALYQRAGYHRVYWRWDQHARLIALLSLHPVTWIPAMRLMLQFEIARSEAGRGRLAEALARVRKATKGHTACEVAAMEGSIYATARDFDGVIAAWERAVSLPGGEQHRFDLARTIVTHTGDVARARRALGDVDPTTLTETQMIFWLWAEVEIAIAEGRPDEALSQLAQSTPLILHVLQEPDRGGILLTLAAVECRALADLDRLDEARAAFGRCRDYLVQTRNPRELERCKAALASAEARGTTPRPREGSGGSTSRPAT